MEVFSKAIKYSTAAVHNDAVEQHAPSQWPYSVVSEKATSPLA